MAALPSGRVTVYAGAGIAIATVLAYLPAFGAGFINYDDFDYVTKNPEVPKGLTGDGIRWAFTTNHMANWHPLAWISHMVDASLFGLNPAGHHATSVVIHAANALLVAWLLIEATGEGREARTVPWRSLTVAALFGLHPLHVESVAWVSERKDVLCGFFWLLTLIAWVRWTRSKSTRTYVIALAMFALSLMAKPMAVTLPFVLLLLDVWPLARQQHVKDRVIEKVPFFALSIASSIATYIVQKNGGAMEVVKPLAFGYRLTNVFVSYARYVLKTIAPVDLAIIYPHPPSAAWPILWVLASVAFLGAITVLAARARKRPAFAPTVPMWLLFLGVLVPTIGLVQVGAQAMADRYMYLPLLGLLVILVWGVAEPREDKTSKLAPLVAAVAIAACAILTYRQSGFFKDGVTVFDHAVAVTGPNVVGQTQLGSALAAANRLDDAEAAYRRAVAIDPDSTLPHTYLGSLLARRGKLAEAVREHEEAIRTNPSAAIAHYNLGLAYLKMKKTELALKELTIAVSLAPTAPEPHTGLGFALSAAGRLNEASAELSTAIRLNPFGTIEAREELGIVFVRSGRMPEALAMFQEAVAMDPRRGPAHANLGNALVDSGQLDAGIQELEIATQLEPTNAMTRYALASALLQRGRRAEAIMQYEESLRLDPTNADARKELDTALGR